MASLTYMIYQENKKDHAKNDLETPTPAAVVSSVDLSRDLFSSFRTKSTVVDSKDYHTPRIYMGVMAPKPPRLRDLLRESGILGELECDEDLRSILEVEVEEFAEEWTAAGRQYPKLVDTTLRNVMEEILTMDDQDPLPCTCSSGACIYHDVIDEATSSQEGSETVSIPSRQSRLSSFDEIPHYCTPQFEPQYLTPMKVPSTSKFPGTTLRKVEESQPSMSQVQHQDHSTGRPPLCVDTSKKRFGKKAHLSPEEADDIVNSSHVPHHIPRLDSVQTYQTMVSEITLPYEMASPVHRQLRLDPRAPQFQMAMVQQKKIVEKTVRTHNHSILTQCELSPPVRRPTPEGESPNPPVRKQSNASHQRSAHDISQYDEYSSYLTDDDFDDEDEPPLGEPIARRGTIGGTAAAQPTSNIHQPMGPFVSPTKSNPRGFQIPSSPRQDSNPLLYPADLISPSEEPSEDASISHESIVGPFVSPGAVSRRYRAVKVNTPKHDSNPLLFPQGIGYYPPSPTRFPVPPNRAPSPAQRGGGLSGQNNRVPTFVLPLETASSTTDGDTKRSSQSSGQTSGQSTNSDEFALPAVETNTARKVDTVAASIRVKMNPREISYVWKEQLFVHTGFYSGPINRHNDMHGNGVFKFSTGDLYLGQFVNGQMHGVGIMAIRMDDGSHQILRGIFRQNEFVGVLEDEQGGEDNPPKPS